jgi:hypothetical protein
VTREHTNLIGWIDSGRQQSDSAPPISLLLLAAAKTLMCQAVDSLQSDHSLIINLPNDKQTVALHRSVLGPFAPSLLPLLPTSFYLQTST